MGFLHGVEVIDVEDGPRAVRTLSSAVVGLVGTALEGPVNTPTVVSSRGAAEAVFGADGGTLPDAVAAVFEQARTSIVVVNALDPAVRHRDVRRDLALADGTLAVPDRLARAASLAVKSRDGTVTYRASLPGRVGDYAYDAATRTIARAAGRADADTAVDEAEYDAVAGVVTLPHQRIKTGASLTVKSQDGGTTYQTPRDYTVDADAGTITRVNIGSSFAEDATVKVAYTYLAGLGEDAQVRLEYDVPDAAAATVGDVVGGTVDGARAGVDALLGAESVAGLRPRILAAPGWTDQQAAANALLAAADRLRAVAVIDGPDDDDAAAVAYRGNFDSRRAYLVDPAVRVAVGGGTATRPGSGYAAGVVARTDAERGFWWSPSNKPVNGVVGTTRAVDLELGVEASAANVLNASEVATFVRLDGWRLWGNRTCSSDPKYAFLSVSRTADLIMDSILRAHLWAVDRNITRGYVRAVTEGVNAYLRELRGAGAILGGTCRPSDENTPQRVEAGQVCFDFDFTPPAPAERVTFRAALVNDYVEEII